jgi:HEAT repeat protein
LADQPAHRIQLDPECNRLFQLEFNPGEELLGNIAAKADDVPNRIRAHRELIKIGTSSALSKVEQAVLAEKYHGVRSYVATALGEARTRLAVDLLCKMLEQDREPMSTWRIAKSCVGIRDAKLRTALLQFLKRPDLAYR